MTHESMSLERPHPPPAQVEIALARVEQSAAFRQSPRHRALLRHLVSRLLAGSRTELKETVIAVEVFGRPAASFDPRLDSIVRVEARRLRARLADYYRGEGRETPIRIELPVGTYVPLIAARQAPTRDEAVTRRARDLVERGEHFLRQALSKETLESALGRFDLALRESPAHAPALTGMARAWFNLAVGWYHDPAVASEHAAEALRQSLQIDPDQPVTHVLFGAVQHQFERDWPAARKSFERAVTSGPELAFTHSAYGCHLTMQREHEAAEHELALARKLDPHYVNTRLHMINLRMSQGRLDDAEAEIEAMRDIAPETMQLAGLRGVVAMFRGDAEAAVGFYERACEVSPDYPGCFVALAGAHALAGRIARADALLGDVQQRFDERRVSPYVLAICMARCRRPDAAFALLRRALAERDPNAILILYDTSFEALHGDPRWAPLAAAVRRPHRLL